MLLSLALACAPWDPSPSALPLRPQDETLLSLWTAPGSAFFNHPKDKALGHALELLGARLMELPGEFPEIPIPAELIPLAVGFVGGEKALRITMDESGGPIPLALQLDWEHEDAPAAVKASQGLSALIQNLDGPLEEPDPEGWRSIPAPLPMAIGFGPQGTALSFRAGEPSAGKATRSSSHLPEGTRADIVLDLNLEPAVDLALEVLSVTAPDAADFMEALTNIFALDEFTLHLASGVDANFRHGIAHFPGLAATLRERGLVPEQGIQAEHLGVIPKDAFWFDVMRVNLSAVFDIFLAVLPDSLPGERIPDPVEFFTQLTGVHLERDLLDHLGSTFGWYVSETTGANGLASLVAFLEVTDSAGLRPLLERLEGLINGVGLAEANGYVQARRWEHQGIACTTLATPGIPVPLELSLALSDNLLILGATPRTLVTALDQVASRDTSILDNENFQASAALDPIGSYRVAFINMPNMMSDGYGTMSFLTSALANASRSRRDESRDAGIIMPAYRDLFDGAKAWVEITHAGPEDIHVRTRSDPSLLSIASCLASFHEVSLPALSLLATLPASIQEELARVKQSQR